MAGVAARALVIMAIGMLLAYAGPDVEIILAYYGVMFLLAVPLLGLTPRVLAVLSAVFAIGGPILLQALRGVLPGYPDDNPTFGTLFTEPFSTVGQLLFTGFYPAVPWMAYMCAGLAIGKLDLSSRRIAAWLAAGGACLAAAAWALSWLLMIGVLQLSPGESAGLLVAGEDPPVDEDDWAWLVAASPYSSMPLELLHTIGTSMVALGVLILAGKYIHQIIDVLAPAGSMTLTLYSGHLLFLASGVLGDAPVRFLRAAGRRGAALRRPLAQPCRSRAVGVGCLRRLHACQERGARQGNHQGGQTGPGQTGLGQARGGKAVGAVEADAGCEAGNRAPWT